MGVIIFFPSNEGGKINKDRMALATKIVEEGPGSGRRPSRVRQSGHDHPKGIPMNSRCYFTVTGSGPFPLDCLRRNEAWPSSPDAVAAIAAPRGRRSVRLGSVTRGGPIAELWASYGWTVSDLRWLDETAPDRWEVADEA